MLACNCCSSSEGLCIFEFRKRAAIEAFVPGNQNESFSNDTYFHLGILHPSPPRSSLFPTFHFPLSQKFACKFFFAAGVGRHVTLIVISLSSAIIKTQTEIFRF